MVKVILTQEQKQLLETGHIVDTNRETYYNLPFWFKKDALGNFEIVEFRELPSEVKNVAING